MQKRNSPLKSNWTRILKRFPEVDKDKNGKLSTEEFEAFRQQFLQSKKESRRPAVATEPMQGGDTKLRETLAEMNARFTNVEVELLEWPDELHKNLGKMTKHALVTRPVRKLRGSCHCLLICMVEGRVGLT